MSFAPLLSRIRRGAHVYLPGSAGEVPQLTAEMLHGAVKDVHITASFVPGINPLPRMSLVESGCRLQGPFALTRASTPGYRQLPASYGSFARWMAGADFDVCIVHVAPPDAAGRLSLGAAVEFTPLALRRSRRVLAVVNPQMPSVPAAPSLHVDEVELMFTHDAPLCGYDPGVPDAGAQRIAGAIAALIGDGDAVQIGLGKVPDALMAALRDRRGLRLHSGMLSDGMRGLYEAGALDPDFRPVACVHVGTAAHYAWMNGRRDLEVLPVTQTHDAARLVALGRFVAVNSALEVDLFGQANLETAGGRAVSGVGGAADFARAAALNPLGLSVIGLPALTPKGVSRIVPALTGPVSLPRQDIDVVVTEFGTADLRGLSVKDRALRLIAVAAPTQRAVLEQALDALLARL